MDAPKTYRAPAKCADTGKENHKDTKTAPVYQGETNDAVSGKRQGIFKCSSCGLLHYVLEGSAKHKRED